MPHSTLKNYLDIAKTVNDNGPLNVYDLASFLKVNPSSLKERVNFLISQRVIGGKGHNSIPTYIITERGIEILKFFKVQPLIKVTTN